MPLDPSISLQATVPNPTNYISGFLDLGRKKLELDKAKATYGADVSQRLAESQRAGIETGVAADTAASRVSAAQSTAGTAAAQMNSEQLENARKHAANIAQQMETLRQKPDLSRDDIVRSVLDSALNANAPNAAILQALQGIPDKGAPAETYQKFVMQSLSRAQQVSQHLSTVAPAPTMVSTGQEVIPVASGNPAVTGVPAGTPQGPPTQMQIPPTATTMGPGGQPVYRGPQPAAAQGPVPSGPAIGQVEGAVGPIQVATRHYEGIQQAAQAAPTRVAALQTIMQEAPKAVTGGGDYKRKIIQQLSGALGIATDEQTATDVMAKNLSLIAGQAGNTDAARSLAEMATPNYRMTKEAIQQTGQQLIGIEKKNLAAAQVFSGIPTNDPRYAERMVQWNKVSDPRLFEYASLPDDQKAAWMKKLSPGVRAELSMKARALDQMGVSP